MRWCAYKSVYKSVYNLYKTVFHFPETTLFTFHITSSTTPQLPYIAPPHIALSHPICIKLSVILHLKNNKQQENPRQATSALSQSSRAPLARLPRVAPFSLHHDDSPSPSRHGFHQDFPPSHLHLVPIREGESLLPQFTTLHSLPFIRYPPFDTNLTRPPPPSALRLAKMGSFHPLHNLPRPSPSKNRSKANPHNLLPLLHRFSPSPLLFLPHNINLHSPSPRLSDNSFLRDKNI